MIDQKLSRSPSLLSFLVAVCSRGSVFLVAIAAARLLPAVDVGQYAFLFVGVIASVNCFQVAFAPIIAKQSVRTRDNQSRFGVIRGTVTLTGVSIVVAFAVTLPVWLFQVVITYLSGGGDSGFIASPWSLAVALGSVLCASLSVMLQGLGSARSFLRVSLQNALLHVCTCVSGAGFFGVAGLVIGTAVSSFCQCVNVLRVLLPRLGSSRRTARSLPRLLAHKSRETFGVFRPAVPLAVTNILYGLAQIYATRIAVCSESAYADLAYLAGAIRMRQFPDLIQSSLMMPILMLLTSSATGPEGSLGLAERRGAITEYLARSIVLLCGFAAVAAAAPVVLMELLYGSSFGAGSGFLSAVALQGQILAVFVPVSTLFTAAGAFRLQSVYALMLSVALVLAASASTSTERPFFYFFLLQLASQLVLGWAFLVYAVVLKLISPLPPEVYLFLVCTSLSVCFGLCGLYSDIPLLSSVGWCLNLLTLWSAIGSLTRRRWAKENALPGKPDERV